MRTIRRFAKPVFALAILTGVVAAALFAVPGKGRGSELLIPAVRRGDTTGVRWLLRAGVNPNTRDAAGWSAISNAVRRGDEPTARALIVAGADINALDPDRLTPLTWAARYGHLICVRWLIGMGAALDRFDGEGRTPLLWATRLRSGATADLIAAGADVNARGPRAETPLLNAAAMLDPPTLRRLVERGADVSATAKGHGPALYFVAARPELDSPEVTEAAAFLLDHGADINVEDIGGLTPLHAACWGNRPQPWRKEGGLPMGKLLIDRGARVNATDGLANTPLHLAAEGGAAMWARLLVEAGADLGMMDDEGKTPADRAQAAGHADLAAWLREQPARSAATLPVSLSPHRQQGSRHE